LLEITTGEFQEQRNFLVSYCISSIENEYFVDSYATLALMVVRFVGGGPETADMYPQPL